MKQKYKVVDCDFNQANYPDLIGQVLDTPPAYAKVELIQEKPPMEEIFKYQSRWIGESYGETRLDDFIIKCLKAGYEKDEIIEGLGKFYSQAPESANGIFNRAVVKYKGIKPPKEANRTKSNGWYKKSMKIELGEKGLDNSWQATFAKETKCEKCGGNARIGFVTQEDNEEEYVSQLHPNKGADGGKYWLHDACSVAIYFCEDCLEPTAEYNQA